MADPLSTRADGNPEPAISEAILQRLREQTGDEDGELVRELVEVFVLDAEETVERLMELFRAGDATTVASEAHRLKSGAGNLGAQTMAELCSALERAGNASDLPATGTLILHLSEETQRVVDHLQAYVAAL